MEYSGREAGCQIRDSITGLHHTLALTWQHFSFADPPDQPAAVITRSAHAKFTSFSQVFTTSSHRQMPSPVLPMVRDVLASLSPSFIPIDLCGHLATHMPTVLTWLIVRGQRSTLLSILILAFGAFSFELHFTKCSDQHEHAAHSDAGMPTNRLNQTASNANSEWRDTAPIDGY